MKPEIINIEQKKLIGLNLEMSLAENKTSELWQKFMPVRKEISHRVNTDFISMQVYDINEKNLFEPKTRFKKWAVVEVSTFDDTPDKMEKYSLSEGKYAVFIHKGPASTFPKTMQNIFENWFPESEYELDNREHFEVLPENYNPGAPDAVEEIWLPVKLKL